MEVTLTSANFEAEVLDSKIPVLVDFWATWCGPCRMVAPIVEKLAEDYEGRVKVGKVNVDDAMALAMEYGIVSIPTLMVFKDGNPVDSVIGYAERGALDALLAQVL